MSFLRCPIIPDKKLAFVAIPKNAGTSIRTAFGVAQGFINEHDEVKDIHRMNWPSAGENSKIRDLRKQGYLRFCVCRNPWERLVSCWQQKKGSHSFIFNRRHHGLFKLDMKFDDFVNAAFSVPDYRANRHYRSQFSFISHRRKSRRKILLIDQVLRFESLIADWEDLRHKFGLPVLPHHNNTGATNSYIEIYKKYPKLETKVADRYASDIAFFGYDFHPGPTQNVARARALQYLLDRNSSS